MNHNFFFILKTNIPLKLEVSKLVFKRKNIEKHDAHFLVWPLCLEKENIKKIYMALHFSKV